MTTKSDEEQIHTILENLYYAGVEHDTIEVTGGGDNQERAIAKAASKLQAMLTEARQAVPWSIQGPLERAYEHGNGLDQFQVQELVATLSNQTEQKGA